jgi:hypothetical protein
MKKMIEETIGWYGACAILLAYVLLSFGVLTSASILYHAINITGAAAIAYHSLRKKDYQPLALNLVWVAIALVAIALLLF